MRARLRHAAVGAGAFLLSSLPGHRARAADVPRQPAAAPPALDLAALARQRELDRVRAEVERRMDGALPGVIERVAEAIVRESTVAGFDPLFVVALIEAESGFEPDAVSDGGAKGLMQLIPRTFRAFRRAGHILDPVENVCAGVRYLASIIAWGFHRPESVVLAYNQGVGGAIAVVRGGAEVPAEASKLYRRVMAIYGALLERHGKRRADAAQLFRRRSGPISTAPAMQKVVG